MIPSSTRAPALHWLMLASGALTFLLMLAVSLLPVNGLPLLAFVMSLLTAQLGLILMVLFWSVDSVSRRAWHAALYACWIYFAIFGPPALVSDRFGYGALPTSHAGMGILAGYGLLLTLWKRQTGTRLSKTGFTESTNHGARRKPQFTLFELMKWVTLICVALGMWSAVTVRFLSPDPLIAWTGVYYVYSLPHDDVAEATFYLGGPVMGATLTVFWMVLSDNPRRWPWVVGLTALWAMSVAVCFGTPLFLLAAFIHALVMRQQGWRITSIDRQPFRVSRSPDHA